MTNEYDISLLNSNYLDELLDIEKLSFSSAWKPESFLSEFELTYSFTYGTISKIDSKLTGFIIFWLIEDEIHILNLATHPATRRSGIATSLIKFVVNMAYKISCNFIFLEVRPSNKPAINLYESLGFKQVGIRPNYYHDSGEDALLYTLFLNANN